MTVNIFFQSIEFEFEVQVYTYMFVSKYLHLYIIKLLNTAIIIVMIQVAELAPGAGRTRPMPGHVRPCTPFSL